MRAYYLKESAITNFSFAFPPFIAFGFVLTPGNSSTTLYYSYSFSFDLIADVSLWALPRPTLPPPMLDFLAPNNLLKSFLALSGFTGTTGSASGSKVWSILSGSYGSCCWGYCSGCYCCWGCCGYYMLCIRNFCRFAMISAWLAFSYTSFCDLRAAAICSWITSFNTSFFTLAVLVLRSTFSPFVDSSISEVLWLSTLWTEIALAFSSFGILRFYSSLKKLFCCRSEFFGD